MAGEGRMIGGKSEEFFLCISPNPLPLFFFTLYLMVHLFLVFNPIVVVGENWREAIWLVRNDMGRELV